VGRGAAESYTVIQAEGKEVGEKKGLPDVINIWDERKEKGGREGSFYWRRH